MKSLLLSFIVLAIFAGCSAAEFNAGADSIGNDVSNAFNSSNDK